jgi:hypothetical protein
MFGNLFRSKKQAVAPSYKTYDAIEEHDVRATKTAA